MKTLQNTEHKTYSAGGESLLLIYADTQKCRPIEYKSPYTRKQIYGTQAEEVEYDTLPSDKMIKAAIYGPIRSEYRLPEFLAHKKVHQNVIEAVRSFKRHLLAKADEVIAQLLKSPGKLAISPTDAELDEMSLKEFGVDKTSFISRLIGLGIIPNRQNLQVC